MSAPDREAAILAALRAAAPDTVSGETLAAELGVSRVAVGKRVTALREHGYDIEAVGGQGYRLLETPDAPLPAEVGHLLRSPGAWDLKGGGATGSTNDDAKVLARSGAAERTVVLASEQTAGRGRLGRDWTSPSGGVYLSVVLRPALTPAELAPLPLVAGVGVAHALDTLGCVDARLKWPNDVYRADGRKFAGILVEMAAEADRVQWAVVGVGLNVRAGEGGDDERACYVADALGERPAPSLPVVAAALLDGLDAAYARFLHEGFEGALRDEYERRSWLAGREVRVRDANGTLRASGSVAGVDATGRLVVETADGATAVAAGEVTLREGEW